MGYVPGFEWDIFISYARKDDDTALPEQRGWVSSFADSLSVAVTSLLGEDIRLFFDRAAAGSGNARLEEMKIAARSSAVFVVIASPTYPNRDWTMAELQSFLEQCDDPHRLFVAERLPLGEGDSYPMAVAEKNYREFWSRLVDYEGVEALESSSTRFKACMADFAFKMQRHLRAMRSRRSDGPAIRKPIEAVQDKAPPIRGAAPDPASTDATQPLPDPCVVLIAQTSDDVAEEAEQVRAHLDQYPEVVRVLAGNGYPQGGEEFKRRFAEDLEQADLFIQLLGLSPGRMPPDLPEGYTRFQLAAARSAGKRILLWRHPELPVASVTNEAHRALLSDPHVAVTGMVEFKAEVVREARQAIDGGNDPDPPPERTRVFVDADRENLITAKGVASLFEAEDYDPVLTRFDGSVQENRTHLNRMMSECGVLFVLNGDEPPIWWTTQKRLFKTIRHNRPAKPAGLAVCSVPPADQLKADLIDDEFVHIDCSDGWDPERIRDYIRSLRPDPGDPRPKG